MNSENYTKIILTVIAALLLSINIKLWTWPDITKRGDLVAFRTLTNEEEKKKARERYHQNIPVIWIQGGSVDADVSGSVSIER